MSKQTRIEIVALSLVTRFLHSSEVPGAREAHESMTFRLNDMIRMYGDAHVTELRRADADAALARAVAIWRAALAA